MVWSKILIQTPHQTQEIHVVKEIDMYYITDIKQYVVQYIQTTINISKT